MKSWNLYKNLPDAHSEEIFKTLLQTDHFKLEQIISEGQVTPRGEWLQQSRSEWVLLLRGGAKLQFEGGEEMTCLQPGDCCEIPAGARHRVEWTDPNAKTVWLAFHYDN